MRKDISQIHRAGWVMLDSKTIFRDGYIKVESGHVKDAGRGNGGEQNRVIDHGPGLIMPSLVNAHTHLELCGLKDRISFGRGLIDWVKQVISKRDKIGENRLKMESENGVTQLLDSGCKLAGEISTLGLTREVFFNSNLQGIWFKEYLGNKRLNGSKTVERPGQFCSQAVHAPHTTHPALVADIFRTGRKNNLPVSVHLAESEEEIEFLTTGKGVWADFLEERGIDFSGWGLPSHGPLKALEQSGHLNEKTIAVHLIHTDPEDHEILLRNHVHVCLCPRSNYNLYGRLPDIHGMLEAGIKPCLGTDSLASNDSLSIFDEMAFLAGSFPDIRPEAIIKMATIHGARALGYDDRFGTLNPGKISSLIYLPIRASNPSDLIGAVVNKNFTGKVKTDYI